MKVPPSSSHFRDMHRFQPGDFLYKNNTVARLESGFGVKKLSDQRGRADKAGEK